MLRNIRSYSRIVGLRSLIPAFKGKLARTPALLAVRRPDVRFPFFLRVPSSDVPTFDQVFLLQEYDFDVSRAPRTIVDAGANIGLASIYFANRYPDAKIIAIEAERSNFEVLQRNVSPYANIVPVHAALWSENGSIDLVDPGLGKWGFMTQRADGSEKTYGRVVHAVRAMTVDAVLKEHGVDRLDILKIDIEGAEREVFRDPSSWIGKVDALIVELHERMKSGCNRNFYNGSNGFDDEWLQGENVYLTRSRGCVVRRSV